MGTTQHTSVCGTHPSEQQADRLQPRGRYTLAADAENDRFVTLLYTCDLYLAFGGAHLPQTQVDGGPTSWFTTAAAARARA